VPSLLNWHFTDRFYHTNQDTLDKVSADEVRNVGVAVATSAWLLATADDRDALAVLDLLKEAASKRLALERRQDASPAIIDAWIKWYGEAFDSVLRLPSTGVSGTLGRLVIEAKAALR
jgi:hypothetical protein